MADVLFIIAQKDFRDEELFDTEEVIKNAGFKVEIASKTVGIKKGMLGGTANADIALGEVNISNYKAIIFIGGSGASAYFDNAAALSIAKMASSQGKILGAICIAPVILANAGVLKGKRATVWDDPLHTYSSKLKAKGAKYTGEEIEQDGKIITADGPNASEKFGEAIVNALKAS